jgi:hypothetical protein
VHSKYKHEPDQLPSSKITYLLKDLNADEQRNLIFQLHVPKVNTEQSTDMLSQEPMSQSLSGEQEVKLINNHVIGEYYLTFNQFFEKNYIYFLFNLGHVSVTYIHSISSETVNSAPVPFQLIRAPQLSADLLQINRTLDRQRNRVETALALKQAMDEKDYKKSIAILTAQVEKIKSSVSAQDPFCQQLMNDLKHRFPTERDYRSTNQNSCVQQSTERGTYSPAYVSSGQIHQTPYQQQYMNNYHIKRSRQS